MAKAYVRVSVVKVHVKERVKEMRVSEEAIEALDKKIEEILNHAVGHAVADKRKTIKARDIA